MYSYLIGKIVEINSDSIVIENNQIGYHILVSNPYSFFIGKTIKIFLYQNVREDELSLFGFKQLEEKKFFLDLISVKGIGPKSALVIIAAGDINSFKNAILKKDINYLIKFPKIGKKSAQQIILDLENKYEKIQAVEMNAHDDRDEVEEALISLGYDKKSIKKVIDKVNLELTTENKIKEALKLLIKI